MMILIIQVLTGCASIAHRPESCSRGKAAARPYGWFYRLMGLTVQQGDCAIIEPLRIEFGEYYSRNKPSIIAALKQGHTSQSSSFGAIHELGKYYGCSEKASPEFANRIFANGDQIFGANYETGARQVMKNISRVIGSDPMLSKECTELP